MLHAKRPLDDATDAHQLKQRRGPAGIVDSTNLPAGFHEPSQASASTPSRDAGGGAGAGADGADGARGVKRSQVESFDDQETYSDAELWRMQDNSTRLRGLLANIAGTPDKRRFSDDLAGQISSLDQEVREGREEQAVRHSDTRVCTSMDAAPEPEPQQEDCPCDRSSLL